MSHRSDGWTGLPRQRPIVSLAEAIAACVGVGASGSVFTARSLSEWYPSLAKPALAPPNWVFGPVWTALFYRVDRRAAALLVPYLAWVSFAA